MKDMCSMTEQRRGVVVVMALVCMATFSLIAASMLHGAMLSRSFIRSEHHLRQASLLLDAACHQVVARLAAGGSLADERVVIPAEEISGRGDAQLVINGEAKDSGDYCIHVTVEYPRGSPRPVRRMREIVFNGQEATIQEGSTNNRTSAKESPQ